MSCEAWQEYKLEDIIQFNPKEIIHKNSLAKKISMDKLKSFDKVIDEFQVGQYKGGSKFRNNDTLLARITPCLENGKTAKVNILDDGEVGFGSTEFIVLRAIKDVSDADFIYYLSISPEFRDVAIKSMIGTTGRQRVQEDVLKNHIMRIPLLSEQKAIAATLSCLDDKIELNNRINKTLEEMAQAIFKSWFVDFEPFQDGEFVDSELGLIPRGWKVGTLGDAIELMDSKRVPLSGNLRKNMKKIYPYYGAASLMDYVDNYIFDGIYLLVGEDGTVIDEFGHPIVQYVWGKFWVNNHAHVIQGKNGLSVESLYALMKRMNIKPALTGAVQLKVNQANLNALKILVPQQNILNSYDQLIQPLFRAYRKYSEEKVLLTKIRDSLLPKLISGKIQVPVEK